MNDSKTQTNIPTLVITIIIINRLIIFIPTRNYYTVYEKNWRRNLSLCFK